MTNYLSHLFTLLILNSGIGAISCDPLTLRDDGIESISNFNLQVSLVSFSNYLQNHWHIQMGNYTSVKTKQEKPQLKALHTGKSFLWKNGVFVYLPFRYNIAVKHHHSRQVNSYRTCSYPTWFCNIKTA